MTSRRQFIKKSLYGSLSAMPFSDFDQRSSFPNLEDATTDDELFALVRQQLQIPDDRIYLNTGSLGPSPVVVTNEVYEMMNQLEMNPAIENWGVLGDKMEEVRFKVGKFVNAEAENIILTRNTTEGLSLIGQSLYLSKGDEILTTTHEHGGGEVGLDYLAARSGAIVKKIQLPVPAASESEIVDTIEKNITEKTKVIMLSHVNTLTGLLMPLSSVSRITKERNILLVADGAQAPGMVKVDIKSMGVDAYAASGHKWMLGPKETGFVYWSKELQKKINPVFTSSGLASYSASSGTRNVALICGLGVTIDWLSTIGIEKIELRCNELRRYCHSKLTEIKNIEVISPEAESLSTGIISFALKEKTNKDVFDQLAKENIIVKVLPRYNGIRVSCHMFISKRDIDVFAKSLSSLMN